MRVDTGAMLLLVACSGNNLGTDTKTDEIEIIVSDSSIRLDEDGSAPVVLSAEAGGEIITYEIVTEPSLGQLVGSGAQWEYVPDSDVNGEDTFTWKALAGGVESAVATVSVFIDPVNDAPVGVAVQLGTGEDTPITERLQAIDVEGDPLSYTLVAAPDHGTVDLDQATGDFTYTPDPDFTGQDGFLWSALDTAGASTGPVRVDLSVVDANDPPTVLADSFVLAEDESLDGALVGEDPDGDPLTWRVEDDVAHGVFTLNTNLGTFTYVPWSDYYGPDSVVVVANDGGADSAPVTIDFVVTGVNDAPEVPSAILEVNEDGVLEAALVATDVENDALTFRVDSPARNGVLALDPVTGEVTYTPSPNWSGVDEFTVVASDASLDSLPGRVTVVVQPVNDAPTASGGTLLLTDEDTSVAGAIRGADPEGDPLTYLVATPPSHGTLTLSASTGDYVYTPALDYNGSDVFGIQAFDGQDSSGAAMVTVQVASVNDAPRVTPATLTVVQDTTATLTLPAVDPEGDLLYFLVSTPPLHGTASLESLTGVLRYTPDAGYSGSDVLLFSVSDGQAQANGILPITVSPDSDADEVPDLADNCPEVPNTAQGDVNGNTLGDACDCWTDPFGETLDPDLWAGSELTSVETSDFTSPSHAVALLGDGAYLESQPAPGCPSHQWEVQVQLGSPAPEALDALVISARVDDGAWVLVDEIFGTGAEESFQPIVGTTDGLGLAGSEIQWRIEVVGDEIDDVFTIDDFSVSCDTDADWLPDCVESGVEGYDLTDPDPDGDGWLDGDEYLAGSDPNASDTDLDGVYDPADNCPIAFNPTQADTNGDGYGDACDLSVHDDFAAGLLDPVMWVGVTGDGGVTTEFAHSDIYSLRLSGGGSEAEALPIDFRGCTQVAWYFMLKPGPEPPDSTDHFLFEAYDSATSTWTPILDYPGNSTSATVFTPRLGSTTSPLVMSQAARLRFSVPTTTSGTGYDEWFIDDVVIGCDLDGDDLPNYAEQKMLSTDQLLADTDGDGVEDGAEVLAGTDPLSASSN